VRERSGFNAPITPLSAVHTTMRPYRSAYATRVWLAPRPRTGPTPPSTVCLSAAHGNRSVRFAGLGPVFEGSDSAEVTVLSDHLLADGAADQLADDATPTEDQDPVTDRGELLVVGTRAHYGRTRTRRLPDRREDLLPCADVHASRGFVEQDQGGSRLEPLGQKHLL